MAAGSGEAFLRCTQLVHAFNRTVRQLYFSVQFFDFRVLFLLTSTPDERYQVTGSAAFCFLRKRENKKRDYQDYSISIVFLQAASMTIAACWYSD